MGSIQKVSASIKIALNLAAAAFIEIDLFRGLSGAIKKVSLNCLKPDRNGAPQADTTCVLKVKRLYYETMVDPTEKNGGARFGSNHRPVLQEFSSNAFVSRRKPTFPGNDNNRK